MHDLLGEDETTKEKGENRMSTRFGKMTSIFVAMAMVLALLAGCGSKSQDAGNGGAASPNSPVKLEFWTISLQPTFNDYFNNLIKDYEAKNPGVTIDWKDFPLDVILNKLMASIASNESPDVVNLNTELANQMGSKNSLVDMNTVLTPEQRAAYFQGIYKATELNGKAFALPWYTGLKVLFLNKNLVQKAGLDPNNAPKTKDELVQWGRTIKEKTGAYGYTFTIGPGELLEEGLPLLSKDYTKAGFNTPEVKQYIENNVKLLDEGVIPRDNVNYDKLIQYYASEQVAMVMSSSAFINKIKTAAPDIYKQTMAVPGPVGKGDVRFSNSMNIAVPSASKNQKEAIKFAVFLTNAENQLNFSKIANTLPSTVESAKDPFFTQDDGTLEAQAKIASAKSLDKATDLFIGVANAKDVNDVVTKALQNIYLNKADVKSELDKAEKDVNNILSGK